MQQIKSKLHLEVSLHSIHWLRSAYVGLGTVLDKVVSQQQVLHSHRNNRSLSETEIQNVKDSFRQKKYRAERDKNRQDYFLLGIKGFLWEVTILFIKVDIYIHICMCMYMQI